MFYLDMLAIKVLTHKIRYIPLHAIPPINLSQIAVYLSGTWMNKIPRVMGFCKNMLSQLANIRNTQFTLVANYTISPLGENLHFLIMDYTLKFKQDWITVLLFLNLHYQRQFCPVWTVTPLSDIYIRWTPKQASLLTSFTSSFISSSNGLHYPHIIYYEHLLLNLP